MQIKKRKLQKRAASLITDNSKQDLLGIDQNPSTILQGRKIRLEPPTFAHDSKSFVVENQQPSFAKPRNSKPF